MAQINIKDQIDQDKLEDPFADIRGMWADYDIDLKKIRQQAFERRTRTSSDEQAGDKFPLTFGMWEGRDIDLKKIRQQAFERRTHTSSDDKRLDLNDK
ncbi:MAG: hypothetical protein LBQ65_08790 [Tannerellaceae bacterium]|jgi:hypothetical protein|nr:hypothetical protein [Tannerellaceae bacterium]